MAPAAPSPRRVSKIKFSVAAVLLHLGVALHAQATRLIDPLNPAYRDLSELVNAGLVATESLGQRPLSRAAFAKAVAAAERQLAPLEERSGSSERLPYYRELIASLRERLELPDRASFGTEGRLDTQAKPLRVLSSDFTRTDQPTRLIPRDNGIGSIDASLNTLLANRDGRPLSDGSSALVESVHSLETDHVA